MSILDGLDWREPANDNFRKCDVCGVAFPAKTYNQKYCGKECRANRPREKRSRVGEPRGGPERICEYCGKQFRRRSDKKNAARFCSRQCGYDAGSNRPHAMPVVSRDLLAAAKALKVTYRIARCKCVDCGARFQARSINTQRCVDCAKAHYVAVNDNGRDRSPRPCATCGVIFAPEYGDRRRKFCSAECNRIAGNNRAKETGLKAANRLARKMAERAATVENVNPIEVFERDGWRCRLCGVRTPKGLRGTYEPNAPELDHILPIAAGGEHSYRNTQCACRKCNGAKSATPLGQMLLFG